MNKTEAKKIIASMMVMFNNYKPVDINLAANIWADTMEEYTYEQVSVALKTYLKSDTSGFPPTPGKLIEKIQLIQHPQYLNEMEAWALVSKALRNSGYNSVSEFSKLPTLVKKAVGLPDQLRVWALDENYNEQVISSNFIKTYRKLVAHDEEISKMPAQIRTMIEKSNEDSDCAKIEQKCQRAIDDFQKRDQEWLMLSTNEEGVEMPDTVRKRKEELFGMERSDK